MSDAVQLGRCFPPTAESCASHLYTELTDAFGQTHSFMEKVPIVTVAAAPGLCAHGRHDRQRSTLVVAEHRHPLLLAIRVAMNHVGRMRELHAARFKR